MAFKFDTQEPFPQAIPRIARERINQIIESLSEKPHPGAEAIHDARKNLKSLRALLRLARGPSTTAFELVRIPNFATPADLFHLSAILRHFWKPWNILVSTTAIQRKP